MGMGRDPRGGCSPVGPRNGIPRGRVPRDGNMLLKFKINLHFDRENTKFQAEHERTELESNKNTLIRLLYSSKLYYA